jgi:hypothetical protein
LVDLELKFDRLIDPSMYADIYCFECTTMYVCNVFS